MLDNYWPVSNLSFLGKVLKDEVVTQLQGFQDKTGDLDTFQPGFFSGFGSETALVLCWELNRGSAPLLLYHWYYYGTPCRDGTWRYSPSMAELAW